MDRFDIQTHVIADAAGSIYSQLYIPKAAGAARRCPLVIYSHGMMSNHSAGDAYARAFADKGYAVCCFDFRGGNRSLSDGEPLAMTPFTEVDDLNAVYNDLVTLDFVDANNVFLMGASLGGLVTALVAGKRPNLFKGIVLLYPALSLPQDIAAAYPDPMAMPATAELSVRVGRAFLESLYGFDPYGVITGYTGPVLILHGTQDSSVPSSYSVKATRAYRRAHLELISGAGHGFSGGAVKFATRVIVEFLDEESDLADESGLDGDLNFGGTSGMGL